MTETIRSYWVLYLPYREFSQTCCRLWTGMLFRKKTKEAEREKQGRRVQVTSDKRGTRENQVQAYAAEVWLQSYKLALRGGCCPLVQPLGCGASETWLAWAGTTSSPGCGTFAPANKRAGQSAAMLPADRSIPALPSLPICLAEGGDGNMQMRGGPHRAPPPNPGSF